MKEVQDEDCDEDEDEEEEQDKETDWDVQEKTMGQFPRLTRRRFYGSLATGAAGLFLYAWRVEPHWVEVVERELVIAHLPEALAGQSLIQISDLHVGDTVDADYLIASLELVSSLRPAMTVITGSEGLSRLDSIGPHAWRTMQATFPASPDLAGEEQTLYLRCI